jgi:RNase P subunit RPR2
MSRARCVPCGSLDVEEFAAEVRLSDETWRTTHRCRKCGRPFSFDPGAPVSSPTSLPTPSVDGGARPPFPQ